MGIEGRAFHMLVHAHVGVKWAPTSATLCPALQVIAVTSGVAFPLCPIPSRHQKTDGRSRETYCDIHHICTNTYTCTHTSTQAHIGFTEALKNAGMSNAISALLHLFLDMFAIWNSRLRLTESAAPSGPAPRRPLRQKTTKPAEVAVARRLHRRMSAGLETYWSKITKSSTMCMQSAQATFKLLDNLNNTTTQLHNACLPHRNPSRLSSARLKPTQI